MIVGKWHPKDSTISYDARLIIVNDLEYRVTIANGDICQGKVKKVKISERLDKVERTILLADASWFTTTNDDAVDSSFTKNIKRSNFLLKYKWTILALIGMLVVSYYVYKI